MRKYFDASSRVSVYFSQIGTSALLFVDTLYMTWRLPPLAAAFNSETASFLEKIKRNGGFDYFKTAMYKFFSKKFFFSVPFLFSKKGIFYAIFSLIWLSRSRASSRVSSRLAKWTRTMSCTSSLKKEVPGTQATPTFWAISSQKATSVWPFLR